MTPVLDKGWIKVQSTSMPGSDFDALLVRINRGVVNSKLLELPQLILEIRCPLFVQTFLAEQNLHIASCKTETQLEAYTPSVAEIGSPDLKANETIQANIAQVSEALLLNPQLYQMDQCDKFISQVNVPVSVYTTIIVWASLINWTQVVSKRGLPRPIEEYRVALNSIITAEWPNVNHYIRQSKSS